MNNKEIGICHIYVIHALKGYEQHEQRLRNIFEREYSFDFDFVTDGDPSLWTEELINRYFSPDIRNVLSKGSLSCTLNHILSYERMVQNGNQLALIFENDPFFINRFEERIAAFVKETEQLEAGFIVSIENSTLKFPSRKIIKSDKFLYPAQYGRCAGAYLIDRTAVINIMEDLKTNKCATVIDWWHNDLINRKVVKMYWAHPPIVEQGSHNGKINSPLSSKPKSWFKRISWILQKYYKTYFFQWIKCV